MDLNEKDQVAQDEAPMTIEQLPIEAQFEILTWFEDWDLHNVQQVCRLWHAIVDEWIGREVSTQTRMLFHPGKVGLELISLIGVRKLIIYDERRNNVLIGLPSPLPSFKFPYLLKEIQLYRVIQSDVWTLLGSAFNLTRFTVSLTALTHLTAQGLEQLNFQRLKGLRIYGDVQVNDQVPVASLENLRMLLREKRFPPLSDFSISNVPVESARDLETIGLLLRFIHAHSRIVKLDMVLLFSGQFAPINRPGYQDDLRRIIQEIRSSRSCTSLRTCHYWGPGRPRAYPHSEIFSELLLKQRMLEELKLKMGFFPDDFIQTLCSRNGSTLKRLEIHQWPSPEEPRRQMDMGMFSSLRLVDFHFSGQNFVLTGAHHLPPTLEQICLSGHIPSADIEFVLLHLPNLRKIYLFNGSRGAPPLQEGYWVTLDTLQQFVENRRVTSLTLKVVMGVNIPEEGIPNGDPVNPVMLWLRRLPGIYYDVRWSLNQDGYYNNESR